MMDLEKKIKCFLKESLFHHGFKKKYKTCFQRSFVDAIQMLTFGHSTHNEVSVRYLTYTVSLTYPTIDKIATQLHEIMGNIGVNVGYLMPEKSFKEWRLVLDCPDECLHQILNNIMFTVEQYAIPFLDKYSNIEELIVGLENGELRCTDDIKDRYLPILYYLLGNNHNALLLVDEAIKRRSAEFLIDEYKIIQEIHNANKMQIPQNKALDSYIPFAEEFKCMLKSENVY
ncbi:hypothetical protein H8744_03700 [Oscillospiraceae bacterium N12]|jgi:hypothetical protein|uniref:Uncharacterized protein n=1 Tax=Jilunia laotingensis TaxID=2763675 RepID=A0A926F5R0_9BACT|nr:hypothetical protein [Jilunia laotingensis]MBC8592359.1 hypothetical protein [Jilunia laotingensis]